MEEIKSLFFRMFRIADMKEPFEELHYHLLEKLSHINAPFGLMGVDLNSLKIPHHEQQKPYVRYKHPSTPRVIQHYQYEHRGEDYGWSQSDSYFACIDKIFYEFKPEYKKVNFHDVIYTNFPQVIEIIEPRVAENYYVDYAIYYEEGYRPGESPTFDSSGFSISLVPAYNDLRARGITPNGRNNIYTLSPACYWDNDLCQTALGYDRDEVICRLAGKVPDVRPLADGVYIIFNDNPLLSFDDFLAIQHTFKPILGLQ